MITRPEQMVHAEIAWFVRDVAVALGYEVFNPLDLRPGVSWSAEITRAIDEADVIVADVSATSSNVMFELGVATATSKPVLLVARSLSDLPFDLQSRHLVAVEDGTTNARISLARALMTLAESTSPVTAVMTPEPPTAAVPAEPSVTINVYSGTVFQGPITVSDQAIFAGHDANISVSQQAGDLPGLLQALQTIGLNADALTDLEQALREDQADPDHTDEGPGPRFRNWWTRMTIGSAGVAGKIGVSASGGVVAKLIEAYFNMH